jgi:peptide-methionine (S)-S-oxide reductase
MKSFDTHAPTRFIMFEALKRFASRPFVPLAIAAVLALPAFSLLSQTVGAAEPAVTIPAPTVDEAVIGDGLETAVIAGGCFWGIQAVYQHVEGVASAMSGYSGGSKVNPTYEEVSSGTTGHAESVEIKFDPKKISYGKILQIFFSVAHNPTQLNYQGPDRGTQYRSAIFYRSDEQKKVAEAYVAQLGQAKAFPAPIVTEVTRFGAFYPAEDYHQDYAYLHPDQPYIAWNDLPKVENLKTAFPAIYRDKPVLVMAKAS